METIEDLKTFTVAQLKAFLAQRGQSTEGLKKDLLERAIAAWKTENSDSTTEKTTAQVGVDGQDQAAITDTTQAPVTQQPAPSPLSTAARKVIAGADGGQTSDYARQPTDDDHYRPDYDEDAHRAWLERRVQVIEERDRIQAMQDDFEEDLLRAEEDRRRVEEDRRRAEEDRRREDQARQRSERADYLRRRRDLEKRRLLYLADAEASGLFEPGGQLGHDLTLPDMPDDTATKVLVFSALPDVDNLTTDISTAKIKTDPAHVATVTSYNRPISSAVADANAFVSSSVATSTVPRAVSTTS